MDFKEILLKRGLTKRESKILGAIITLEEQGKTPTQKAISELTNIPKTHVSTTIKTLKNDKIVTENGNFTVTKIGNSTKKVTENGNSSVTKNGNPDKIVTENSNFGVTENGNFKQQVTENSNLLLLDESQIKTILSGLKKQIESGQDLILTEKKSGNNINININIMKLIYIIFKYLFKLNKYKNYIIYVVNYFLEKSCSNSKNEMETDKMEIKTNSFKVEKQDVKSKKENKINLASKIKKQVLEKKPKKKLSKNDEAAQRLLDYWNGLGVVKHRKGSQVYRRSLLAIKSLLTGSFRKKDFDPEWMRKMGLEPDDLVFTEKDVEKTFDEIAVSYKLNGNRLYFPKSLDRIIYNPDTKKSVFLYTFARGVEHFEWWKTRITADVPEEVAANIKWLETYTGHLSNSIRQRFEVALMRLFRFYKDKLEGKDKYFDESVGVQQFMRRFVDWAVDAGGINYANHEALVEFFDRKKTLDRFLVYYSDEWDFIRGIIRGKGKKKDELGELNKMGIRDEKTGEIKLDNLSDDEFMEFITEDEEF